MKDTKKEVKEAKGKSTGDIDITQQEDTDMQKSRERLKQRFGKKRTNSDEGQVKQLVEAEKKKGKKQTDWGYKQNVNAKDMKQLDLSKKSAGPDDDKAIDSMLRSTYIEGGDKKVQGFYSSDEESHSGEEEEAHKRAKGLWGKIHSSIKNVTGNKVMEEEEIQTVLSQLKDQLMSKNVAEEIAQKLCESMKVSLLEKKTGMFQSVQKVVKESMKASLTKILTSSRQIDIVKEANEKRSTRRPYVITFIGVNGVGKSTNLAKVAYMFKNQGFKIMLAACDNFRAGAVEQI